MDNHELHEKALDLTNQYTNYTLARKLVESELRNDTSLSINEWLDMFKPAMKESINELARGDKSYIHVGELFAFIDKLHYDDSSIVELKFNDDTTWGETPKASDYDWGGDYKLDGGTKASPSDIEDFFGKGVSKE